MPSPNTINDTIERPEGVSDEGERLSLDLTDKEILRIIGERVENGVAFWNKKLKLDKVRKRNGKRWLNKNFEVSNVPDLYDHQEPNYRDNRIFLSIETIASSVAAKIPEPVVTEAFDTDASRELAGGYGRVLKKKSETLGLKGALQMATRHILMGYRAGIIKYSWNYEAGRLKADGSRAGDLKVEAIRPHKIVIDAGAIDPDDIPLIAEYKKATVEELIFLFPEKKKDILNKAGISELNQENKKLLGKKVDYVEIWFSFYDKKGNKKEAVAWKLDKVLLGAGPNPNFNYNNPAKSNFFDGPEKPYVFFTFLREGQWVYDDTSLTEQAASLQDNLEKRGRQITENADKANSTKVFNIAMIKASDVDKYIGDPRTSIKVKGDVRMAFARVPPPLLPRYVAEDKYDSREEIDNIFGTHRAFRGEKTKSPTLGQEVLSQRSDLGRTRPLTDIIEEGAVKVYKGMTQLYKVFAEEEHIVKYTGEEGSTIFAAFSRDRIEDGIEINIQAGSMQADDKTRDKTEAMEIAKMQGKIDPLSFFEKWHVPNPRQAAKRLFYFLFMPDRYAKEILKIDGGEGNEEAMQTIQRINAGENVPPQKDASKEYLATYNQFVRNPAFKQLDPETQQLHIMHLRGTVEMSKSALGGKSTEEKPTEGGKPGIMDRLRGIFKGGK